MRAISAKRTGFGILCAGVVCLLTCICAAHTFASPPLTVNFTWRLLESREATVRVDYSGLDRPVDRVVVRRAGREMAAVKAPTPTAANMKPSWLTVE